MFVLSKSNLAAAIDGIWTDILVVLFPLSFCLKKKAPKKSRHKGGLRRDSLRSYSAQFPPLCIPPYDCSADSDLASYRPKRSASIMPRVSYFENARIKLGFFPYGMYVHPMPQ